MNRRFLWSLLLALILPLAQVAAAAHEVSHVKGAPQSIQCDQCAAAAAVSGGAAASTPSALPAIAPLAAAPVFVETAAPASTPFAAFRSRAPPSSN